MKAQQVSGIRRAAAVAGGQSALARLIGCSQQNVHFWVKRGYAPLLRAVEIEQQTGVYRIFLIDPRLGLSPDSYL